MSDSVPLGWSIQTLDGKVDVLSGFPFKSSLFCDDPNQMGLIRIRDLVKQRLETFYRGDYDETYVVRKGDVLIGMDGDFSIVRWQAGNALLNQRICQVKASAGSGFDTGFLFYSLAEDLEAIHSAAGATTVKHLSVKDIRCIEGAYPPLPEQQKIATILSSVDDVIEKTRAQIDKLKDLKTGMMQELLTKGIGPDGGPHREFKDSPVGRIPVEWEVVELSKLVSKDRPITYGIVQTGENSAVGVPCVRVVDLMQDYLSIDNMIRTSDEISERYKRTILRDGDIMFALRGEIGHVRLVDRRLVGANLTRGVALISPSRQILSSYLLWALRSSGVRNLIRDGVNGSALQEIPLGNLRNISVPVPSLSEQEKLSRIFNSIENRLSRNLDKFGVAKRLKSALMQDLLSGKVRVNVEQPEAEIA